MLRPCVWPQHHQGREHTNKQKSRKTNGLWFMTLLLLPAFLFAFGIDHSSILCVYLRQGREGEERERERERGGN
jgi:hypothetical protein